MNFAQCISDFSSHNGLVASLFLGGLAGGFTHCAGMCAPFVLAQGGREKYKEGGNVSRLSGILLIPYHLGRMSTYVLLAMLFFSVLNLAFLFTQIRVIVTAFILMLAGVLFLASVFPALYKAFPWVAKIQIHAPIKFIGRYHYYFLNNPDLFKRYLLGVLLGFMPCGLVIAAIMAASTASGIGQAALAMTAFSIGTIPALILVAIGGQGFVMKFPRFKRYMRQGAMAVSAIWLFILAGWMMI